MANRKRPIVLRCPVTAEERALIEQKIVSPFCSWQMPLLRNRTLFSGVKVQRYRMGGFLPLKALQNGASRVSNA